MFLTSGFIFVAVSFAALLVAVRRRWFSRFRHGFSLTLLCVLGAVALATAVTLGLWGYHAASEVLFDREVSDLGDLGDAAKSEITGKIADTLSKLHNLAASPALREARTDPDKAKAEIQEIQNFNPRAIQITVVDRDGKLIVRSSDAGEREPVNHVAMEGVQDGKTYVSDPYFSKTFNRFVVLLTVPVTGAGGRVDDVISLRYDFQAAMAEALSARYGNGGYLNLVDASGTVISSPQASQIGQVVSNDAAFARVAGDGGGWYTGISPVTGQKRLYVCRRLPGLGTVETKPLFLLSGLNMADVLAPVHTLRGYFALAVVLLVAVWLVSARFVARSPTAPLGELVAAMARVKENDLTARIPARAGCDEFSRLALTFNDMVHGLADRDRIKQVFGRYVTNQVSEKILNGHHELGGRTQNCTMLFSDIRNFTALSEGMAASAVVELLNEYFTEMVEAVFEQEGVLDKFIGDGMLATFGALEDQPDHCLRAVKAALRMKAKLAKINGERSVRGQGPIDIGIGIHTDDVIVGNIGSQKRLEFTVIGDGVNTCSRVEAMNKQFGTTVLITEKTYAAVAGQFECRAMPETAIRGKTQTIRLFEVVSAKQVAKAA